MDDNAKKMAILLRKGYTMLNQSCPICNNPIFREKNGENFCPICNRKVVIVEKSTGDMVQSSVNIHTNLSDIKTQESQISNLTLSLVRKTLLEKIEWTCQKLKNETQVDMIEKYSNILKNFIKLTKKISNIQKLD